MLKCYAARGLLLVLGLISLLAAQARAKTVEFQVRGASPLTFTFNVVAVPFVAGEITDDITFEATFAPQSTLISLPTLSEAGGTGRLDKATIWSNAFGNLHLVSNYLVDALDQEEGIWRIRGNYHIDGQLRLISEGATLFTMPLTEVFFGGCGGTVVAPCTVNHSYVLFGSNIITLLGPDTPETIELVIDQLRVFGKLNDDRGTFSGAEYSGYWSTDAAILEVAYDYTPVSEVPLPGAAWLMLSAIACLGFMRRARGGDMRARHPAAACSRQ